MICDYRHMHAADKTSALFDMRLLPASCATTDLLQCRGSGSRCRLLLQGGCLLRQLIGGGGLVAERGGGQGRLLGVDGGGGSQEGRLLHAKSCGEDGSKRKLQMESNVIRVFGIYSFII